MHVCVHFTYICTCSYIGIYVCVYIHLSRHLYISRYMYICAYAYTYIVRVHICIDHNIYYIYWQCKTQDLFPIICSGTIFVHLGDYLWQQPYALYNSSEPLNNPNFK